MGWIIGKGIGVPFRMGGGQSWISYWLTRYIYGLSVATTSDTEQTITAIIIGSGYDGVSWEYSSNGGSTWTVKGTSAAGTYNASGLTQSTKYHWRARLYKGLAYSPYNTFYSNHHWDVTRPTSIATNSRFWIPLNDKTIITRDSASRVSSAADKNGSGRDLLQATDAMKPFQLFDGLFFNNAHCLKSAPFTWNQPEFVYLVVRMLSWTSNDFIFDGNVNYVASLRQNPDSGSSPELAIYAGTALKPNGDLPINKVGIVRVLFKGNDSFIQVNGENALIGPAGAGNAGGFTLGTRGDGTITYCHMVAYEVIGRDTEIASDVNIYNYLNAKWGDKIGKTYTPQWATIGTVLEATTVNDGLNVFEPVVMIEGNPQILTGNSEVFKMWYTSGWVDPDLNYAESLDGVTWTKYANNPIIQHADRSNVIKVNGVYWLYCHNEVSKNNDLYLSNDGINFVLDTADVLTRGGVGAWDEHNIANSTILIENETWYMFYDGTASTGGWKTGLATSPDGKIWTKYGEAAVINSVGTVGSAQIKKAGEFYFMYVLGTPMGSTGYLPTDLYRYKSKDLVNWYLDTPNPIFPRATADEGVGDAKGQVADPFLIEYNSKCYLFYVATPDGSVAAGAMHIKLAIADTTLDELVETEEGRIP